MKKGVVDFITLGCSKNLVDAERLMRQLEAAGWCCVHDAAEPNGEIAVVNTCGFIGDAKEESINTILQLVSRKERKQLRKLIVMGCLSERYRADLEAEIPEVDAYFGKFDYMDVVEWLGKYNPDRQKESICSYERKLTTPTHYAYLKISEGCNRMCSYCAIPLITGRHTSRPMEEILDEVRWLVAQGVKEFNVIAQDLSSYGLDLERRHMLPELIDAMAGIDGVAWIRLHYTYPTDFPMELLDVMARHSNVCK
ncbi:MAG: radical SAM protein, partial [Paludibacteraceae bacterium]|nr:radical SAM protein [Paludibacteraceae bacterium]